MQALRQFSIPIKGLKYGEHEYKFDVLKSFFDAFPESLIKSGNLTIHLKLDRKPNLMDLDFHTSGYLETECDRCTANINLPIESSLSFIVKYSEDEKLDDEVFYIHPDSHELNVANMIYEQIMLAVPIIKVYDCDFEEPRPCDDNVLDLLEREESEEVDNNNLFGEALKNLKITKTK